MKILYLLFLVIILQKNHNPIFMLHYFGYIDIGLYLAQYKLKLYLWEYQYKMSVGLVC